MTTYRFVAAALALAITPAPARAQQPTLRERFTTCADLLREARHEQAAGCFEELRRDGGDAPPVLFNLGLAQRALARRDEALASFERFLEVGGDRVPAARREEALRYMVELRGAIAAALPTEPRDSPARPDALDVVWFLGASTLAGLYANVTLQSGGRGGGVGALVGLGLGLTLHLTTDFLTDSAAAAITGGTTWGLVEGVLLANAAGIEGDAGGDRERHVGLVGLLAGTATGATVGLLARPSRGDVALVHSGMLWGLVVGMSATWTAIGLQEDEADYAIAIASTNAGLVAALLATPYVEMTRARTLYIDLGGVLGLLAAAAVNAAADLRERAYFGTVTAGTLGGLVAATLLTDEDGGDARREGATGD